MRKILYYTRDKRYKDDFKPVYAEAPWYLWIPHWIFGGIGTYFLSKSCDIQDKIQDK